MIQTKNYYLNTTATYSRSEEPLFDLGYSLDIPANDIYFTGCSSKNRKHGEVRTC